jgi:hypothetical protein
MNLSGQSGCQIDVYISSEPYIEQCINTYGLTDYSGHTLSTEQQKLL